jgi:general secretion pathway protein M
VRNTILARYSWDRLRSLPPRDQLLVAAIAAAVLLILFFSLWLPLQRELTRLRSAVPQEKVQLAQMQVQALAINQLRASARAPHAGGSLLAVLEQSATASGLRGHITRMEPEGASGARVALEGVNFDALIGWLDNLQRQGGVRVDKAAIEGQPSPGVVNARLTLHGTGA